MQRRALALLIIAALGLGTAACKGTDKKDANGSSSTTTTTAPSTTSTGPSATTTIPNGPAQTPQAAADGLYDSWVHNNQEDASRYAKPQAISKLFAHPYTEGSVQYQRQPCTPQGGQFNCVWTYEGGSLQMTVENWPGGGYVVDSVFFVAD